MRSGDAGYGDVVAWRRTRPLSDDERDKVRCAVDKFLEELYDETIFEGDDKENKRPATDSTFSPFGDWGDLTMEDIIECAENETLEPWKICVGDPVGNQAADTVDPGRNGPSPPITNIDRRLLTSLSGTGELLTPAQLLCQKLDLAGVLLHEWMHHKQCESDENRAEADAYKEQVIYWCCVVELLEAILELPPDDDIDKLNDSLADFARMHGLLRADFEACLGEARLYKQFYTDKFRFYVDRATSMVPFNPLDETHRHTLVALGPRFNIRYLVREDIAVVLVNADDGSPDPVVLTTGFTRINHLLISRLGTGQTIVYVSGSVDDRGAIIAFVDNDGDDIPEPQHLHQ